MADAACREHPDVDFFPGQGEDVRPAKAVCYGCLVQSDCLAFAQANFLTSGIWGGTSVKERRRMSRSMP
jgi:WhiB family redox-sensing transcriptional regulator